ncbi:MAG: dTMP kinase [Anaerolineaceae bacterium 4572_78]|nr:MAG: dTMP kinase [Anaerolineaceae bacterium 4572_78]
MSYFITFEGPDGSGKSSQIKLLAKYLQEQGHHVHVTREPGGTPIGDKIRQIVHDTKHTNMDDMTEVLLYAASRSQHVSQVIKPFLAKGDIVLCDRYFDSTYAYQGYGRGLNLDMLKTITKFATQGLTPDLTILLDLPVEVGLKRNWRAHTHDKGEWNRMDDLTQSFHERVRHGYTAIAYMYPQRWRVINAMQEITIVHEAIRKEICTFLKN